MKVVFDAYWWIEGPASVRHVLREIVLAWLERYPDDELVLVVRTKHLAETRAEMGERVQVEPSSLRPQALLAHYGTRRVQKKTRADAIMVHNFAARSRVTSAVYLHDVLFLTNPEWFTMAERAYFSLMPRWVKHADIVLTSSRSEANRIENNTSAGRVSAVGLGLSKELTEGLEIQKMDGLSRGSFILTVGRLNIRKNLESAIEAYLESNSASSGVPLVVVGAADGKSSALSVRATNAIADGRIVFTGHVSEAQLRWLYQSCGLFLFLSVGEGFGMPPVEALYFGAPLLVSDLPVFHETLGQRAMFVDPLDISAITLAIDAQLSRAEPAAGVQPAAASLHNWTNTVTSIRNEIEKAQAHG